MTARSRLTLTPRVPRMLRMPLMRLMPLMPLMPLMIVACASLAVAHAQDKAPSSQPAVPPNGRTNTVFVTATEDSGAPVLDLGMSDFSIKEDGRTRDVLRVETANVPIQLMILVDDNGTGIFRFAIANFVQQLQGRAEVAISSVVGQTQRLVDYTTSMDKLETAIQTLTARPGTPDGGQLLEGIFQAAKDQERREASRPVIVALTVGGEEHSTLPAHHVLDQLARSGSALYVIAVVNSALRSRVQISKPAALLEENLNLSEVLGEGPKQSGGARVEIVAAPGIVLGLQRIAVDLKNQYAVAYSRPPKGKTTEKLNVSVNRRGVSLRAPTRVPGR
jgi:VWFA-related protein